ncbi:Gfo/Idh/MocA family oxidoreductase, partial [Candidatus Azambacteria bacterium]|nr:Gfo/Idh/MocA family oxidoreductase [Candidatus Azambacteria bacterium]
MKKNKFVVIGLGKRGSTYIKLLEQNPRIDIIGVCDNDVKRNNNIGIKFFKDYKKMLSDVDFDCAVICTPPNTHYDIASYMVKNGKNIIV